jgi:phospholipid/cholesterol/gamma-HCH transport system substrate-binding protein
MADRQKQIRLGAFVAMSLGLLAVLVVFFGGAPRWLTSTNRYVIVFSDAPGLAPGTPVRKSGVKVGEVSSIHLDDVTGQVKVDVQLDSNFTPRTSDEPTVTRGLIVGDTAIDFIPRSPDKAIAGEPIRPGTVMQGASPFNAKLLIEQATGVVPEAQKSLVQLRQSLAALEKMSPQMETTFKEIGDLAKSSREFIPELRRTNDDLRDLFANSGDLGPALKNIVPELRKTNDEARYFLKTASFWIEEFGASFKKDEPRLVQAIDALATTTERIGNVFTPENQKSITEILKNVDQASSRFDRLALGTEDLMKDARTAMKTFSSTMAQAEQAVTEVRQATRPLAERSGRILENVENSTDQLNKLSAEVREIVNAISRSEGTLMKVLTDPALYNNLNETTVMLLKLMPRMDRILKDVEVFADKIARHPESLGIGGAIRPSAGLKEAPTTPINKHAP